MRLVYDHDFHIHSGLSTCSSDPEQTPERILRYAKENHLRKICLTDHFWDSTVPGASDWYAPQNTEHLLSALPLPKDPAVEFYFGCETEMDRYCHLGIGREMIDRLDFVIIPTSHMHMRGFTVAEENWENVPACAKLWVERFQALLQMDLPFEKIGIAHLSCDLNVGYAGLDKAQEMLMMIPEKDLYDCFSKAAKAGLGIELNTEIEKMTAEQQEKDLRIYRIARDCGCKFYFGTDAHHPKNFEPATERFNLLIDRLDLKEEDRFDPFKK